MTNSNENIKTGTIVTDITDHFPTVFYKKMNMFKQKSNTANKYVYKGCFTIRVHHLSHFW